VSSINVSSVDVSNDIVLILLSVAVSIDQLFSGQMSWVGGALLSSVCPSIKFCFKLLLDWIIDFSVVFKFCINKGN